MNIGSFFGCHSRLSGIILKDSRQAGDKTGNINFEGL